MHTCLIYQTHSWVSLCEVGIVGRIQCISVKNFAFSHRPLNVTLVFQSKSQRFVRVGLAVPLFSKVAKFREMVAEEGKMSPDQVNQVAFSSYCSYS